MRDGWNWWNESAWRKPTEWRISISFSPAGSGSTCAGNSDLRSWTTKSTTPSWWWCKRSDGANCGNRERLMGFVRTIVRRQVAAHIDKVVHSRREQAEFDSTVRVVDPRGNPEEAAIFHQRIGLIRQVLGELSERDREILTRFYIDEQRPGSDLFGDGPDGDPVPPAEIPGQSAFWRTGQEKAGSQKPQYSFLENFKECVPLRNRRSTLKRSSCLMLRYGNRAGSD